MSNSVSVTKLSKEEMSISGYESTRLLNIGRFWVNADATPENRRPALSGQIDRDLPVTITLAPNAKLVLYPNNKRDGKRDADFRLSIELPTATANDIIELQRGNRAVA